MVLGHEEETYELTPEEFNLAKTLIKHFKGRKKDNPVKANEIVDGVNRVYKLEKKFTDVRLRKIVNFYRCNQVLPIISSSKGYYVTDDHDEIKNMVKSLNNRANSILKSAKGLEVFLNLKVVNNRIIKD